MLLLVVLVVLLVLLVVVRALAMVHAEQIAENQAFVKMVSV